MSSLLALAALWPLLFSQAGPVEDPRGHWEGQLGPEQVRTLLHLSQDPTGAWTGTVDSPDQGAFGLPLGGVEFDGEQLSFEVPATHAHWAGRLEEVAGSPLLKGRWSQRGAELPLEFRRVELHPMEGRWSGTLQIAGAEVRLVLHVASLQAGGFGGSLLAPDQSPAPAPVSAVIVEEGGAVRFEVPLAQAKYEGVLREEGAVIEGTFFQSGAEYELNLRQSAPPPRRRRPQMPTPPFPYRSEEVVYPNTSAGIQLGGTLTLPEGPGPFPAVLLITGSGAQDRDESLMGHKPFMVVADFLSRRGLAVLRVDDRGVGTSTGNMATATSADFATDVHAGIDYLQGREDIDAARIGLLGHSEGGLIAPMVARERSELAFIVLLAGPGTTGERILLAQAALIAEAEGASPEAVEANRAAQQALFEILREEDDPDLLRERLRQELASIAKAAGQEDAEPAIEAQVAQISSPWFRYFLSYDPAPALRDLSCPVLALNGALDLQVPSTENLAAIAAALHQGGNDDVMVVDYPGLNHLFQHCTTGSPSEYEQIEETMSEEVLEDIGEWIAQQVSTGD